MTLRRKFVRGLAVAGAYGFAAAPAHSAEKQSSGGIFSVRDFGATGNGGKLDTKAIQAAIDACSEAGGGRVWFSPGRYLCGTVFLKSGVTLHLEAGAVLLGSTNLADFPSTIPAFRSYTDNYTETSLIYAEKAENIGISGRGKIDGQGKAYKGPYKVRPYMIRIIECRNVLVEDVAIVDSPMWVQHYLGCEDVVLRGLRVHSLVNANNDGIDIDCCRRVRISDCDINSGDDAIVLKSTAGVACTDVVVTNCVVRSACNGLKLGTESNGGFENILFSNCTIYDTRLAGIAVEMVDGGVLDRVQFHNIAMNGAGAPIFVRLGNRARPYKEGMEKPGMGQMRNVQISNVQAIRCGPVGCSITGLPGHMVENVTLSDVRLHFAGGGTAAEAARAIEELPDRYPEFQMFGKLPAYGFFCRHARNLVLSRVETRFDKPDARPALVCEDVRELLLADCVFQTPAGGGAATRFSDVSEVARDRFRTVPL
jgi:polygalacturonase